ncbi:MAG: class I SAM-dependent methyltransferase [Ignavibacteriae bacterium]|nr:class I SAM-dependent methyltransferase [Ignavibacteriota bacterium]MCB9244586.1 class I SAM-dependent methyltransferase [Ignavibacteriales bacterium]
MDDKHKEYFETNKNSWNGRTAIHIGSEFYDIESFKKGKSSLMNIELDALGDVKGRSLLHLQCHFGMDTLSWEREGAIATGIDISDEALRQAEKLRDELGLKSCFVNSNIYDLKDNLEGQFDIVFTSYGVLGWLHDMDGWAEIVSHFTKPGGTFYIVEFHPFYLTFDPEFNSIPYSYFNTGKPYVEEHEGTYTGGGDGNFFIDYQWSFTLSDVINSLIKHGFTIEEFNEYPYSAYPCFPENEEIEPGKFVNKHCGTKIPHMFSIKARKNG